MSTKPLEKMTVSSMLCPKETEYTEAQTHEEAKQEWQSAYDNSRYRIQATCNDIQRSLKQQLTTSANPDISEWDVQSLGHTYFCGKALAELPSLGTEADVARSLHHLDWALREFYAVKGVCAPLGTVGTSGGVRSDADEALDRLDDFISEGSYFVAQTIAASKGKRLRRNVTKEDTRVYCDGLLMTFVPPEPSYWDYCCQSKPSEVYTPHPFTVQAWRDGHRIPDRGSLDQSADPTSIARYTHEMRTLDDEREKALFVDAIWASSA